MPYSKVEKLSDSQQQKHVEFTQYLTKVVIINENTKSGGKS